MILGLREMGIKVTLRGDSLFIEGRNPCGCIINPNKDHRIAMAMSILGLVAEGETTILDAECVSKSYPQFWNDMTRIGAKIRGE